MRRAGRWRVLSGLGAAAAAAVAAAGCRTPQAVRVSTPAPAAAPAPAGPLAIPAAPLTTLEPDYATLPLVDPASADVTGATRPPAVGLTEATVARLAAEQSALAAALERENEVPTATVEGAGSSPPGCPDSLAREIRPLLAAHLRNQAAGDAVVAFYQLADAEGRAAVVRKAIGSLETLQAAVRDAKARGVEPPIQEAELDRQRVTWIGLLGQVELGSKLLDGELKRRLGASGRTADRLQPAGEFGLPADPIDADAAVTVALERRQDLTALRTAYLKLTAENVPEVRELLRTIPGTGGLGGLGGARSPQPAGRGGPRVPLLGWVAGRRAAEIEAALRAVATAEVEVRKRQLYVLIEERERGVADEVRAQAAVLAEQARQVGLARWRAEKLVTQLADLRKQAPGAGRVVPLELEANRARADVIQAVMAWHQAKARLTAAQGLYVGGER